MTNVEHQSYLRAAARSAQLESEIVTSPGRFRVLTGDRPTGALHLGHYLAHWPTGCACKTPASRSFSSSPTTR